MGYFAPTMFDLHGKVAVVTGAASGIGAAIATLFGRQGARVVVVDRSTTAPFQCDVSSPDDVRRTFDAICAETGQIDILVNNAGIAHVGTIEQTSPEDLDRLYAVNVRGVYLCSRAAVAVMLRQGRGVILNMASIASLVGVPDRFAYSMTKGAVLTMTMSIAIDYVKRNIRCNCICPARIHTPFVDQYVARHYAGREREVLQQLSAYQPIGRMGTPEEAASPALRLCP